jgi:hypothetical protein
MVEAHTAIIDTPALSLRENPKTHPPLSRDLEVVALHKTAYKRT